MEKVKHHQQLTKHFYFDLINKPAMKQNQNIIDSVYKSGGGGGGGVTLIFSHIRRLRGFFGFKILNFSIF